MIYLYNDMFKTRKSDVIRNEKNNLIRVHGLEGVAVAAGGARLGHVVLVRVVNLDGRRWGRHLTRRGRLSVPKELMLLCWWEKSNCICV